MEVAYTKEIPKEIQPQGKAIVNTNGLIIESMIIEIDVFEITLENGCISLDNGFRFVKHKRPSNIIDTYHYCYALLNEYGELICWLCDH